MNIRFKVNGYSDHDITSAHIKNMNHVVYNHLYVYCTHTGIVVAW